MDEQCQAMGSETEELQNGAAQPIAFPLVEDGTVDPWKVLEPEPVRPRGQENHQVRFSEHRKPPESRNGAGLVQNWPKSWGDVGGVEPEG